MKYVKKHGRTVSDLSRKTEKAEKICARCEHASPLAGGETVLCERFGVVDCDNRCRKFVYDPLKREPARAPKPEIPDISLD